MLCIAYFIKDFITKPIRLYLSLMIVLAVLLYLNLCARTFISVSNLSLDSASIDVKIWMLNLWLDNVEHLDMSKAVLKHGEA